MATSVEISDDGPVRTLVLAGPARLNALAASTADDLCDAIVAAERDDRVHALVLTGAGQHFSAGGDAEGVLDVAGDPADDALIRFMRSYQRAAMAVWDTPLPVIASVSGIAYGGAFNLAMACDFVVASQSARFCQVFLRRGVVPDFGGAYVLPRLVGLRRATEMMLLADEIDAETALDLGLVNAVVAGSEEALAHATGLAHRVAAQSRMAVSMTKKMLHASTSGTLQASLELEALSQASVLGSTSARRAFEQFQER
ncbi:MAG: enoyl-CoA hydratase/isomerase family protein [Aeromicrobium sp.]|jgi:2-(1,2-epoxy-1,2-dihydrophenyl)acetyl-CoA isomerase|nr:enoyl-CoA hydratase/isomerase family protein [Aeromicrobium sp.]